MTDRIPLDELTSDALDELYAERDQLRRSVQGWRTATGAGMTLADQLRGQLDDTRRTMVDAGLLKDVPPDSDASLAALLRQGVDAHWASMRQVDEKIDRQLNELADLTQKFKAWGEEQQARAEQAEAAIERVRDTATCWEQMPSDRHVYIHEAARALRAALDEPKETRS